MLIDSMPKSGAVMTEGHIARADSPCYDLRRHGCDDRTAAHATRGVLQG
jgi:hypothetical protein